MGGGRGGRTRNYLLGSTFLGDEARHPARSFPGFRRRRRTLESAPRINSFGSSARPVLAARPTVAVRAPWQRSNNTDLSHAKRDFISSSATRSVILLCAYIYMYMP